MGFGPSYRGPRGLCLAEFWSSRKIGVGVKIEVFKRTSFTVESGKTERFGKFSVFG